VLLNNLFYNGSGAFCVLTDRENSGPILASFVGNHWIAGPNSSPTARGIAFNSTVKSGTKVYIRDNRVPGVAHFSTPFEVSAPPIWHESLVAKPSSKVEAWVAANAGARPADRDDVDKRIVNELLARRGGIINTPSQVGGGGNLKVNIRPFNAPANPNTDDNGDGYTNVENLLHNMAAEVEGRWLN
jgi:hypothetical protein